MPKSKRLAKPKTKPKTKTKRTQPDFSKTALSVVERATGGKLKRR